MDSQLTLEKTKTLALQCELNMEQKRWIWAEEAIVDEKKTKERVQQKT
jgi:hypothetical protein